jgi:protoporphyrinogen oxidase
VLGLLAGNAGTVQRNARIYSNNVYVKYPYQANLYGLPEPVIRDCLDGLIQSYLKYEPLQKVDSSVSFHDWVIRTFGPGFGKHFFFPYNTKLWTVPPGRLTAGWVGGFVPRPKLEETILGAVTDQKKSFGYNTSFYYPIKGGIQYLIDRFAGKVSNVVLSARLTKINIRTKSAVINNERLKYDNLVSTVPLTELLELIEDLPAELRNLGRLLRYNSVLCFNLGIKPSRPNKLHGLSWVYFPEQQFKFYRVGLYNGFSGKSVPQGCVSFYVEVSYPGGAGETSVAGKTDVYDKVKFGLIKSGLITGSDKILVKDVLYIKHGYVIYDKNRDHAVGKILDYLTKHHVYSIGRYGAWKYSYIEDCILDGKKTADKING